MTIPCSNVILSVGQGTVWGDLLKDEAVEFRGPAPIADPVTYQTTGDDIFVGGDMFTGPRFAIDAIAAGSCNIDPQICTAGIVTYDRT